MGIKRIMVYLLICLVLLGVLTFSIWHKSYPKSDAALPQKKIMSDQAVSLQETSTVIDKGDKTGDGSYMAEPFPSGRINPFAKLPLEELFIDTTALTQPLEKINNPSVIEPEIKETGSIRGIVNGTNPAAYVEASDGSLRKVRIGDIWLGGKIILIKEDSITIRRGNDTITQKLGE